MPTVVVRYHEIALKGGNRKFFESRLKQGLISALEGISGACVENKRDQFWVHFGLEKDQDEVRRRLGGVFGVANFSFVSTLSLGVRGFHEEAFQKVVEHGIELVQAVLEKRGGGDPVVTFRIDAHRLDKNLPFNSMELARKLAEQILPQFPNFKVQLKDSDITLYVDWDMEHVMLYATKIPGLGGLPMGTAGKVVSLLSAGFDSPVASWMMMKRGAKVVFVHFHSYPAVTHESIDNVERIAKILDRYQNGSKLYLIPLVDYQKLVVAKASAPLRVLLYRRMMVRLAERVMRYERAKALVTGESLGQVASQTLDNLHVVDVLATRPVFRPLIGMDKQEIITRAQQIGTAEISKQPYEDCCSLYVPKAPALAAKLPELEEAEKSLEVERYLDLLWENREVKKWGGSRS